MNKFLSIIVVISCLINLTACDKLKSFPKPKTTENIHKINSPNAQVVTYGKNSPIIDNTSDIKGTYVTHGDNSPVVLGQKR